MKKLKSMLVTLAMLLCCVSASAEDFSVDGIYYNITDSEKLTVAVTNQGSSSNSYSGDVVIPETVTYGSKTYSVTIIGDRAFYYYCTSLTSVTIPNSVTIIGANAFRLCSSLTSVTLGNSVTSIGVCAFEGCSSLTSVTIPSSVTNIGDFAFQNCASLESLVVEEGNLFYDSRDNCNAIVKTNTNTILYGCKNTVIPNSITAIAFYAFSSCSGLTTITIPDGVTIIGDFAFDGCCSLTSISIPNSVATIGNSAFNRCSSLISITLPYSLTRIGSSTFYDCSNLTSITIPDGVTSIGGSAFRGCIGLTEITCKAETPPTTTGTSVFDGIDKTIPLYVPKGSVLKYKAAANWRDFVIIREISETKTDVYLTITDCTNGNVKLKVDEDKPYIYFED